MKKIGDSTNTANANGEWSEGNPAAGLPATLIKADWLTTIQRELINLVLGAGIALNKDDDSQVFKAIQAIQAAASTWTKLTGKPTTISGFGITDAFTKTETGSAIQTAISALVASSPAALDTLKELATALGNDPNFATTITNALAGKAAKATSLAGYGITDAFTKPETNTAIQAAISALVASSPAALDTLNELAAALGNDPNFATTMTNALASKASKAITLSGYGIIPATQEDAEVASNFDNSRPSTMLRVSQFFAKRLTKSPFDATPGLVTITGDAGWGANGTPAAALVSDADAWTVSGSARTGPAWTGSPYPGAQGRNQGTLLHQCGFSDDTYASQLFLGISSDNLWFRRKTANVWAAPVELWHTGNLAAKAQCTAWVNFKGTGTVAILDSYNCLSVTDNGTGDYTINWINQTKSTYSFSTGTSLAASASAACLRINDAALIYSATQLRLINGSGTSNIGDCAYGSVQIFGGQ